MSTDSPPVLPDDWDDLSPLVDRLLDASPSERPALLAELARDNSALRSRLEQLLAECERDIPLLERPAIERFPALLDEEVGPPLPDLLGGRYRIEREIGRGGMARVYLALDVRHARRVAVKVIRHEIASSLMSDRFLREIGIAARLRHPNIMPLYDSGEVDGLLYFVMPYEEGKSLRARLDKERGLGVAEGVSILRDIARALACAHEQGVVHRDIKPDNVLLSGDAAVVTDFGIAKAITVAATDAGTRTVTQAGTIIGTAAYMAPEQAIGDPTTDHRADIYAFGCLAYEVFAGAPPFAGSTTHQVIAAKLSAVPKPLTDHRSDVPDAVARLIERCLERNPGARPASASELLNVLGSLPATSERAIGTRPISRRMVAIVLGLAVMILGVLIPAAWYAFSNRGGPVTISVLATGDSAHALAAGFTDDVASALVRKPWLLVKSRGGARNYVGRDAIDTRATGDSLAARYLLMLSFRQDGGRASVMLKLIRSDDDVIVWAEKFSDPQLETLRDQIANTVADSLRRPAGRFASAFAQPTRPDDRARQRRGSEAYRLFLLAKSWLTARDRSVQESIALFRQAIALDSNYADAWSGLSVALAISAAFQGVPIESVSPEVRASAERAMQLDSTLHEPHIALGVLNTLYWKWAEAEAEFIKAVNLSPHDAEARIQYARMLNIRSRPAEAIEQIDAALEDDPVSSLVLSYKSQSYHLRGDLDSALVWSDRAVQSNASNFIARYFRALLMLQMGNKAEARELALKAPVHEAYSMYALAASGDSATVQDRLARLTSQNHPMLETARAYALLGLGDTTAALAALERATDRHEAWPTISVPALPVFDEVRDSRRFQALLKRVGLSAE